MKKYLMLLSVIGLLAACTGENSERNETSEADREKITSIEQSTERVDATLQSSEAELDSVQNEIDELLKEI